jgi:hypothetical protein
MVDVKAFAVHRLTNDDWRPANRKHGSRMFPLRGAITSKRPEETLTKKTGGTAEEGF